MINAIFKAFEVTSAILLLYFFIKVTHIVGNFTVEGSFMLAAMVYLPIKTVIEFVLDTCFE
jgi:hypothetical protein